MNSPNLPLDFDQALSDAAIDNCVTLVFADSGYRRVLDNWINYATRAGVNNYLVVALDAELHEKLTASGVRSAAGATPADLGELWIYRVKCLKRSLELGFHTVHSDADAVWLNNPLPDLIFNSEADATFTQGTIWPADIHDEWGFVLCCGLYGLRATRNSLSFAEEWLTAVEADSDDQRALNHLLRKLRIEWPAQSSNTICFRQNKLRCFDQNLYGTIAPTDQHKQKMRVCLLPHMNYQRIYLENTNPIVRHILSDEKNATSVIDVLIASGCWSPTDQEKAS